MRGKFRCRFAGAEMANKRITETSKCVKGFPVNVTDGKSPQYLHSRSTDRGKFFVFPEK